jgi:hypothetical protein
MFTWVAIRAYPNDIIWILWIVVRLGRKATFALLLSKS